MRLPRMAEIEQRLYSRRVDDTHAAVRRAWIAAGCGSRIRRGGRIGITVGSRGIANLTVITSSLVALVKESGGRPFILPAMGSHGGATAAGQTAVLRALGVTPRAVGAPVRAAMTTVKLGVTSRGVPVYASREAAQADGLVVMNRVKEHTDFSGEYESGLVKMLAIGVGKRDGAAAIHSRGCAGLQEDVPEAARILLRRLPVLGGIAVLENGYHETADIAGIPPEQIMAREKDLLRRARRNAPRLPFREIDLLIVDCIGKDISGVGFDTHLIGRRMIWGEPEFARPGRRDVRIRVIAARDLTPASGGNAIGIGLADLVTERLARSVDWGVVRANVMHTGFLNRTKLPLALSNDRELIEAALLALGMPNPGRVRIARIVSTLELGSMWVSEGLVPEARGNPRVRVVGDLAPMKFGPDGNLR